MNYRFVSSVCACVASFVLISAVPAFAQSGVSVAGQFGVTFQAETAPVFAVEVSVPVVPMFEVYGTFGRMQNTVPGDTQDLIDLIDDRLEVSAPATFGIGGVRLIVPAGKFQPYAVAGLGFARLSGKLEFDGVDISDELEDYLDESLSSTELAFELGGGVRIPVGTSMFADAGYRYMRIRNADFNVSRVYGGFGFRF